MAAFTDGLHGIQVRLDALANTTMTFAATTAGGADGTHYWTGGNTTLTVPPPPPPCVCGDRDDSYWEHSPEECTWRGTRF